MQIYKKVIKDIVVRLNKGIDKHAIAAELGCTLKQISDTKHRLNKDRLAKSLLAPKPRRKYVRKPKPVPTLWQRILSVFTGK